MFFAIEGILDSAQLDRAQQLVRSAKFVNGAVTAPGYATGKVKNNQEMEVSESYLSLTDLLNRAVDTNPVVDKRLQPRFRTNPIVNRYGVGMFYGEHIDAPIQGGVTQLGRSPGRFGQNFLRTDYSMTLFLTDPLEYDGGELELRVFEQSKLITLKAGGAVCYSTGIPHSVRPITRGSRVAAIYWFQTLIRNVQVRRELWEQYLLEEELKAAGLLNLAEKAASVRNNLVRYLADV